MKSQSVILRVLPILFNILRVLGIIGGICSLLVFTARFIKDDYIALTSPLKIERQVVTTGITAKSVNIKDISVSTSVPLLKAQLKVSFELIVATYLYIICACLVFTTQFQNLRDFFNSIKIGNPFDPKNVNRLKIIACTFLAIGIINTLKQLVINTFLTQEINNLHFSDLYWTNSIFALIWAVVIYIIADVFKYGFLLKQENEEFV